jgi:hypothetical protein
MNNYYVNIGSILAVLIVVTAITTSYQQKAWAPPASAAIFQRKAPIATSDDNAYVAWWSNKTGDDEVMFKASIDGGKTWSNKMNLSNTPKSDSQDVRIAAAGNNVYVTWWERNQTANEPIMKVSNDNGKTFGEKIMLSEK